jgi:phage tail protein X
MSTPNYLTVSQLCQTHQYLKVGGVRALIFNANNNGLANSGAIVRIGRKILIDKDNFFRWIESQNQGGAK